MIEPIEFVHTTFQKPVFVYASEILAVTYMPTFKSVALISKGGAAIPVAGELAEVTKIITAAKAAQSKES